MSMPAVEILSVSNMDSEEDIVIQSITTDSPSFHTSFFKPLTIGPYGNVSLEIVFLPRTTGFVESTLVLHTTAGTYIFQVSGRGTPNPYKLTPFVGVKVPVGVVYEPSIVLYNPHYEVLSAKEIYTSSGFLHLQLPDEAVNFEPSFFDNTPFGGNKTAQKLRFWDIRPHERQAVIKLRFSSNKTGKFQGFVNIKTNVDNLILQVEVSVVSGAVHKTPEELDFGIVTTMQEQKTLDLSLLNSGSSVLQVSDLHLSAPDANLDFQFSPTILPPKQDVLLTQLTYHARTEGLFKGKLLLRTNDSNPYSRMEIPYRVRVLSGYIAYPSTQTTFASYGNAISSSSSSSKTSATLDDISLVMVQELTLTNKFLVPLVLFSAEIDDTQLRIIDFTPSLKAEPGEAWPALKIEFRPRSKTLLSTTLLHLSTNASIVSIPLHIYHGKLGYSLPTEAHRYSVGPLAAAEESQADSDAQVAQAGSSVYVNKHPFEVQPLSLKFGVIPVNEVRTLTLNVSNQNPVKLSLFGLWTDVEGLNIKLESVWNSQGYRSVANVEFKPHKPHIFEVPDKSSSTSPTATRSSSPSSQTTTSTKSSSSSTKSAEKKKSKSKTAEKKEPDAFELLPGHSALFSLELTSTKETSGQGLVYVATSQERSAINVTFQSLAGNLELTPERFVFDEHATSEIPLYVEHTYSRSIMITSVTSNDVKLQLNLPKVSSSAIGSQDERHLWLPPGKKIKFGSVAFKPLLGPKPSFDVQASNVALNSDWNRFDSSPVLNEEDVQELLSSIDNTLQQRHNDIRAVFRVTTDLATVHTFPVRVQRWRPTVIAATAEDTSPKSVLFGVTEIQGGSNERSIKIVNPWSSPIQIHLHLSSQARLSQSSADGDPKSVSFKQCSSDFSFPSDAQVSAVLQPKEEVSLGPIVFHPKEEGSCEGTLYIRNNLTTLESVALVGIGGGGHLIFEKPRTAHSAKSASAVSASTESLEEKEGPVEYAKHLLFTVKDAALAGCDENVNEADAKSSRRDWKPPTITQQVFVYNKGNMAIKVDSVTIENAASSSRWVSSSSSSGGFSVQATDVLNMVLWPKARRAISVTYSPDFTSQLLEHDLVFTTNASRTFRIPLKASISPNKFTACAARFESSRGLGGIVPLFTQDLRRTLIVFACLICLIIFGVLARSGSRVSDTPCITSGKESPISDRIDDDVESHKPPERPLSPTSTRHASVNEKPKDKKEPKKDHGDSKHADISVPKRPRRPSIEKRPSTSTTPEPPSPPKDTHNTEVLTKIRSEITAVASPVASQISLPTTASMPPPTAAIPPVTTHQSASTTSGPKKKDKKDKKDKKEKKDKFKISAPIEPNFGVVIPVATAPIATNTTTAPSASVTTMRTRSGSTEDKPSGKKDSSAPVSPPSEPAATAAEKKNKKPSTPKTSSGAPEVKPKDATSTPTSPIPTSPTVTSPTSEKDANISASSGTTTTTSSSDSGQRATLVPAKRPSGKPAPKYARKDGLGKDAPTAAITTPTAAATTSVQVQGQNDLMSKDSLKDGLFHKDSSSTTIITHGKEGKKGRHQNKEGKYRPQQAADGPTDISLPPLRLPATGTSGNLGATGSPSTVNLLAHDEASRGVNAPSSHGRWAHPHQPQLPQQQTHQQQLAGHSSSMWHLAQQQHTAPPGLFPSSVTPLASPSLLHSSGAMTSPLYAPSAQKQHGQTTQGGNTASLFAGSSSPLLSPSALSSDHTLLVPGAMSASRYDYGRRGSLTSSGGHGGGNFDFSMAPSFESHSPVLTTSNPGSGRLYEATTSLSRENSGTPPPMMRLYNPMAPSTGSVENLLASLRDSSSLDASSSGGDSTSNSVNGTPRSEYMQALMAQQMMQSHHPHHSGLLHPQHAASVQHQQHLIQQNQQQQRQGLQASQRHSIDSSLPGSDAWPNIWAVPNPERAVEENASSLSMLGLAAPRSSTIDSFAFGAQVPPSSSSTSPSTSLGGSTSSTSSASASPILGSSALGGASQSEGLLAVNSGGATSAYNPYVNAHAQHSPPSFMSLFSTKPGDDTDPWSTSSRF